MLTHAETQTVLLVADDTEESRHTAGLLPEHRVEFAGDEAAALAALRSGRPPDLVLLDAMLAGGAGWALCSAVGKEGQGRDIPLIVLAPAGDATLEARAFDLGAADFIAKPVNRAALQARVGSRLALHRQARQLRAACQRTDELEKAWLNVVFNLVSVADFRDGGTGSHALRLGRSCRVLAIRLGFSEAEAGRLVDAMPMYDIGHLCIPDQILLKPGKLDEQELAIVHRHAEGGARMIGECASLRLQWARTIAQTHHERWDGTGYPSGLQGEEIPLIGRIVAVADVFDALVSPRPYKQPWSVTEAVDLLRREAGRQFDPRVVACFVEQLPEIEEIYRQ